MSSLATELQFDFTCHVRLGDYDLRKDEEGEKKKRRFRPLLLPRKISQRRVVFAFSSAGRI